MSEEQQNTQTKSGANNAFLYYIIGGVVLIAVIAVGYFLRPQQEIAPVSTAEGETAGAETAPPPEAEPITGLACERQYYNPVVGVDGNYYLTVEGVDETAASSVTCTFIAELDEEEIGRAEIEATLVDATERGGKTFRCSTQGMELPKTVPTKVTAELVDDLGETAACFRFFNLP